MRRVSVFRAVPGTLMSAFIAAALLAALAPRASADQMTVYSCHAPNGQAVGHAGWGIIRTSDPFMVATDGCDANGAGSLHLELEPSSIGYGNAQIEWAFTAPAWASIAEYTVQIADGYANAFGGGVGQTFIEASDESDPTYDYRDLGGGSWGASTVHRTPPDPVTGLVLNSSCDTSCPANSAVSHLDVSSATLLLDDPTTPDATGLSGGLLAPEPLKGTVEASFLASDDGPGVYSAWLVVDGKAEPAVRLDSNNGSCENLGQTSNGTRAFASPNPCAQTANGDVTLNTAALTDGRHTVQLDVDDASGNTATVYDATIETHNAPEVDTEPGITGTASIGSTLTGTPATFTAPEGAGALSSISSAWLRCSDAAASHCSAIAGATGTTYAPSDSDTGYYIVYRNTVSDKDGTTSVDSPPTIAVTAPASETSSYGGQSGPAIGGPGGVGGSSIGGSGGSGGGLTVNLSTPSLLGSTSPWQLTLAVSPRIVRRGTTIRLDGLVLTSPRPSSGKLVYIRARTLEVLRAGKGHHHAVDRYGKWVTFLQLRTDSTGRFEGAYRFKLGGKHTYQFSAVAPQEGGFLNTSGVSSVVTVNEPR